MSKIFIGTSGWIYSHWDGIFYPENLSSKDKLKYYSEHFKTTEINYSFYHLSRPSTYQNWCKQTPEDFLFAVKASRFITHIKRLLDVRAAWSQFIENTLNLKEKLGPILFQFPPSFKATEENIQRLNQFLTLLKTYRLQPTHHPPAFGGPLERFSVNLKYAFEFRHKSWCEEKFYSLLRKHNTAWVIADSPRYPRADVVTADFIYIRMHGSKILFASKYTKEEINDLAKKIKKWLKEGLDVYCYFNNDFHGYAIENAKELLDELK